MQNQSLSEFAILMTTGIGILVLMILMRADYRGILTGYTHKCWLYYQRPWYRRIFLRSARARSRRIYSDEAHLRRFFRAMTIPGILAGLLLAATEVAALITGHLA